MLAGRVNWGEAEEEEKGALKVVNYSDCCALIPHPPPISFEAHIMWLCALSLCGQSLACECLLLCSSFGAHFL